MSALRAVTFDFGQTLAELDTAMLSRRCLERGVAVPSSALDAVVPHAWATYDAAVAGGQGGARGEHGHPWHLLMRTLLASAGVDALRLDELVEWLWTEQPSQNLWRRPIAGMFELARDLKGRGVPLAIVSNSEGRLRELVDEVGLGDVFAIVVDSGRLGIQKPAPGIFVHALELLGVRAEETVHVGDSYGADVAGALGAGLAAIWFRGRAEERFDPARVRRADDAASTIAALEAFGVLSRD